MSSPFSFAIETVERATESGVPLKLLGGQAVRFLTPQFPPRIEVGQDIDFATVPSARASLTAFLVEGGFVPDERFNALSGHKQLYFVAPDGITSVDVISGSLSMCHVLDFGARIDRMPYTLDVVDLLLSKLQVVEQTAKDIHDIVYLLSAFPIDEQDAPGTIGSRRFGEVVAGDWGWWRTVTSNLDKVVERLATSADQGPPLSAPYSAVEQARWLRDYADEVPKTRRWKLRARVGERVRWYELPETVDH